MMFAFPSVAMVMYSDGSSPVTVRNSRYLIIPKPRRYLFIWKSSQNKTLTRDLYRKGDNDFTGMEMTDFSITGEHREPS